MGRVVVFVAEISVAEPGNKDHKSGKKMMPDYDQLKVTFPPSISCQDKILLVCATIILEYLYFQNLSNSKRCSGAPRFLNAYSD